MSALNFVLSEDDVIISMDTLSTNAASYKPHKFVTKMFPLPHMNCVVCGTGNMGAVIDWFSYVEKNIVGNGIYQLNQLTQQSIKEFMREHNGDNTCTIYQFGLHEIDNKFYGYAYRSINEFASEQIQNGVGVKPPDAFINSNGELDLNAVTDDSNNTEDALYQIMLKQKEHDELKPLEKRLGIGGIMQLIYLTRNNIQIKNYKVFDDFEYLYSQMLENLRN